VLQLLLLLLLLSHLFLEQEHVLHLDTFLPHLFDSATAAVLLSPATR
jgi:ascorbate-specific PTS system EIIC-type component UlaA